MDSVFSAPGHVRQPGPAGAAAADGAAGGSRHPLGQAGQQLRTGPPAGAAR